MWFESDRTSEVAASSLAMILDILLREYVVGAVTRWTTPRPV